MWKNPENQFSEEKNITSHLFHSDSFICLYHFFLLEFTIWSWNIFFFSCYLLTIKSTSLHHQIQGHQMSPSKKSTVSTRPSQTCQHFLLLSKFKLNGLLSFLDALASLGSMLNTQRISNVFEILSTKAWYCCRFVHQCQQCQQCQQCHQCCEDWSSR